MCLTPSLSDKDNLNKLLPAANHGAYTLRSNSHFSIPEWKTDRLKNSCVMI